MPIKIVKDAKLFSVEVTNDEGVPIWHSPHPMRVTELVKALEDVRCRPADVSAALREAGFGLSWGQWADEMQPWVEAALDGERDVPAQDPYAEAWIACALFRKDSPSLLEDVVFEADAINHSIPKADEISWAFLRLRERGWLSIEGDRYALTLEGRQTIESLGAEGKVFDQVERLKDWALAHPVEGRR